MKVNGRGRECPVWCRVDHEAEAETDRPCYGQERTIKAEPSVAGAEASLGAYRKRQRSAPGFTGPRTRVASTAAGSQSRALAVPSAWPRPWKPQQISPSRS